MRKPSDAKIKKMSTMLAGALDAAILKYEWMRQASLKSVLGCLWPACGYASILTGTARSVCLKLATIILKKEIFMLAFVMLKKNSKMAKSP